MAPDLPWMCHGCAMASGEPGVADDGRKGHTDYWGLTPPIGWPARLCGSFGSPIARRPGSPASAAKSPSPGRGQVPLGAHRLTNVADQTLITVVTLHGAQPHLGSRVDCTLWTISTRKREPEPSAHSRLKGQPEADALRARLQRSSAANPDRDGALSTGHLDRR